MCLHPGRSAVIVDGKIRVGWIGQLQPELARKLELRDAPWVFEIAIDPSFRSEVPVFSGDFEVPADPSRPGGRRGGIGDSGRSCVKALIWPQKACCANLRVFDVYRGKGVEAGRKSIALGLILQETSRTLTDGEADAVVAAVVERVKGDLKAGIRE